MNFEYYLYYKPFGVVCQFSRELSTHTYLSDVLDLPSDVYPVGRLDSDSEGLLILTNDPTINARLLNPHSKVQKVYRCQVEGSPLKEDLNKLMAGVSIRVNKKEYKMAAIKTGLLNDSFDPPKRNPDIRMRKNIPATWVEIVIFEGKNRQVRRMFAGIGFPVLRLIRWSIGELNIANLKPGELMPVSKEELLGPALKTS